MMKRIYLTAFLLLCYAPWLRAQPSPDFPPPKTLGPVESYGRNIQRTMTLLTDSTPQRRNTVRILFYGQSITEQRWSKLVAEDLRRRFPHANLVIENRAIGGHSSPRLIKTMEADVLPFYPDLVIFHVYGDDGDYERIIRAIRARTDGGNPDPDRSPAARRRLGAGRDRPGENHARQTDVGCVDELRFPAAPGA